MNLPSSQKDAAECGSPKYRTGKPCKHGHISDRWTLTGNCCECTTTRANARRERIAAALRKDVNPSLATD